jgi:HPt (histidine-containing phosphotransfer) domain-containing protein
MSEDFEKKMLAGVAYRMFCEELQRHLSASSTFFAQPEWTPEQLKEASGRFHTIRGGAGFFKLTELSALAGELEKGLLNGSAAEVASRRASLEELDRKLREVAQGMPQPAGGHV